MDSDNSYNDILTVSDNEHSLGFDPSNMWFNGPPDPEDELFDANKAAEYFWGRFTDNLG